MAVAEEITQDGAGLEALKKTDQWVVVLDRENGITDSNEVSFALLGKRPEEIIGRKLEQVIKLGCLQPLMSRGFCFRDQPLLLEGRRLYGDFAPLEDGQKMTGGVFTLKRQEQADGFHPAIQDLLYSMDPFSHMAQESVILVNREGMITMINQSFADVLGIRAKDMLGRHVHKAYPNSNPSRLPVVMDTGRAEVAEPHLLNESHVVVSRFPLMQGKEMVGAFGKILFKDIREVHRLAGKLQVFVQNHRTEPAETKGGHHDFKYDANSIIGHSKVMKDLKERLLRIAQRSSNVLLLGESGTGKELFAHAIHAGSSRRYGPFVRVNCAAIPEHLMESELFGYVEGAFTGARKGGQAGKFEQAHKGTIFLDEISEMPMYMQAKLLRVLQEKEVTPLGATSTKRLDLRVVAATNVNLQELVKEGKFRTDLYYRLNVVTLCIPPLRERLGDIYFITKHLIDDFNSEFDMAVEGLEPEAWEALKAYDFPGNIRELRNAIESAFNVAMGSAIKLEDLPPQILESSGHALAESGEGEEMMTSLLGRKSLQEMVEDVERRLIEHTLELAGGNKLNAANMLGISRPGLYKKLQKYELH